jgi:colicin import membrane protein
MSMLIKSLASWFGRRCLLIVLMTAGASGAMSQTPPSRPANSPSPASDTILQPLTDWFERASREYQNSVVKELSIPTGKGDPLAQSSPTTVVPPRVSAPGRDTEPSLVERLQGWLGIETAKVPTGTPQGVRPGSTDRDLAGNEEMIRKQVEARRAEQLKAAEEDRIAAEARRTREAIDTATLQRQRAAEAARQTAEERQNAPKVAEPKPSSDPAVVEKLATAEAERKTRAAAEKQSSDKVASDKAAADKFADADRKARVAAEKQASEKAASEKAAAEKLAAEADRKARASADKTTSEKSIADRLATADSERKARLEAQRKVADKADAERLIAETERRARATADKIASEKAAADRKAQSEKDKRDRLAQADQRKSPANRDGTSSEKTQSKSTGDKSTAINEPKKPEKAARSDRPEKEGAGRGATAGSDATDKQLGKRGGEGTSKMAALSTARAGVARSAKNKCGRAGSAIDPPGTYTVKSGDTLWSISRRHYDKGWRFEKIVRANEAKIDSPELIFPCQKFYLPASVTGGESSTDEPNSRAAAGAN